MNASDTIEKVRAELTDATSLSKDGLYKTAFTCLRIASERLIQYIETTTGPNYGFEEEKP